MAKPKNHRKPYSKDDLKKFKKLVKGNTPTRVIAIKLERTESAVKSLAASTGTSLKPTNQSPYGKVNKKSK